MNKLHEIGKLAFTDRLLVIDIDGEEKQYELDTVSSVLVAASDLERMTYEISPSGYGIYWPLVDEDLSVDALLGIIHRPALETAKA